MKNKYTMRYVVCLFLISILCFSFIGKDYRLKEVNKKKFITYRQIVVVCGMS